MVTEKEKLIAIQFENVLQKNNVPIGSYALIDNLPFDGILIYKEDNEWLVSAVSRGKIYRTFGRFQTILYAALFSTIFLVMPEQIGKIHKDFYDALNQNVPEYDG